MQTVDILRWNTARIIYQHILDLFSSCRRKEKTVTKNYHLFDTDGLNPNNAINWGDRNVSIDSSQRMDCFLCEFYFLTRSNSKGEHRWHVQGTSRRVTNHPFRCKRLFPHCWKIHDDDRWVDVDSVQYLPTEWEALCRNFPKRWQRESPPLDWGHPVLCAINVER